MQQVQQQLGGCWRRSQYPSFGIVLRLGQPALFCKPTLWRVSFLGQKAPLLVLGPRGRRHDAARGAHLFPDTGAHTGACDDDDDDEDDDDADDDEGVDDDDGVDDDEGVDDDKGVDDDEDVDDGALGLSWSGAEL